MSQYCTQCGTENVNEAKFCKSCGHSLIEQEPSSVSEQSVIRSEPTLEQKPYVDAEDKTKSADNSMEVSFPWSGWLLLIPVIAWMLYRLAILAGGNIGLMFGFMTIPNVVAEAFGGAIAIVGIPLIITTIILLIKKAQNTQYSNFVKHTFVASIVLLALGISSNIHAIKDEQKSAAEQTTSAIIDKSSVPVSEVAAPAAEAAMPAGDAYAAAPAADVASPVAEIVNIAAPSLSLYETRQAQQDCQNGQARRCSDLGKAYLKGNADDNYKASIYFKKACDSGVAEGCNGLGLIYNGGYGGIEEDKAKAIKLFTKACNAGHGVACGNLADMYSRGEGTQVDLHKASIYNKKSCNNGESTGCLMLGSAYMNGEGVQQDYSQAAKYYKKACENTNMSLGCNQYEELQSQGY